MSDIYGAGMPDGWQRLWAPHRLDYLRGENRPLDGNDVQCPFCRIPQLSDEEGLIVFRGTTAFVVMNLYPYNPGHLLVCAYRHVADLTDLTDEERHEITDLSAHAMKTIRKVSGADGFNLGMNQGAISEQELLRIFTNISFRDGRGTQTSCQSSARQKFCLSY